MQWSPHTPRSAVSEGRRSKWPARFYRRPVGASSPGSSPKPFAIALYLRGLVIVPAKGARLGAIGARLISQPNPACRSKKPARSQLPGGFTFGFSDSPSLESRRAARLQASLCRAKNDALTLFGIAATIRPKGGGPGGCAYLGGLAIPRGLAALSGA